MNIEHPTNDRVEAFMAAKTVLRVTCPYCRAEAGAECFKPGAAVYRPRIPHPSRRRAAATKED